MGDTLYPGTSDTASTDKAYGSDAPGTIPGPSSSAKSTTSQATNVGGADIVNTGSSEATSSTAKGGGGSSGGGSGGGGSSGGGGGTDVAASVSMSDQTNQNTSQKQAAAGSTGGVHGGSTVGTLSIFNRGKQALTGTATGPTAPTSSGISTTSLVVGGLVLIALAGVAVFLMRRGKG